MECFYLILIIHSVNPKHFCMNTKIIIAGVLTGIVSFLLGWVVWGMLLMDYYEANMVTYEGMMKDPGNMVTMAISQIASGIMIAYIIGNFSGKITWMRGATIGLIIGLLFAISIDMYFYSFMNWFSNTTIIIVDVVINGLFTALLGAFAGWYLGRGAQG